MARYGQDFGRRADRWNFGPNRMGSGGRDFGEPGETGFGGRSPEGWRGSRRDFPAEEPWGGGGRTGRGYDAGFGDIGGGREMRGMGYGSRYGGRGEGYDAGREWGRGGGRGMSRSWSQGRGRERMRAADIMTENPEAVTPQTTLAEAAQKMRDLDVGIIPVVDSMDSRRLRGVITDRDIAVRAVAEGKDGQATVSEFMTAQVETCNKNDDVDQVMQIMQREQVRRVPITDREGRLVGIIAQADLAIDYGDEGGRSRRVEETLERVSEPSHQQRGRMSATGRTPGASPPARPQPRTGGAAQTQGRGQQTSGDEGGRNR